MKSINSLFWAVMPRVFLTSLCLLLLSSPLAAAKMHLKPQQGQSSAKKHPYTGLLKQPQAAMESTRKNPNYEKLLVILVDFQEELADDPNTTGNGKFQLEADPDYLYTIGSPPHNRQYFENNLTAMFHYYRAASAGSYNLNYDVWPKDKAAYTLPHTMGYYNPPNVSSELFVGKMEEYFKTAFETADADDPEIDFGSYAHYMIIHAGSDWQHDVLGDTPSDLPSFFIRVGDGKQAVVDNGVTKIFTACNVPATISQDFVVNQQDGINIHSGYGALNAVLFHEFGHSLGLVDLYNVRNFTPMVGSFDIMDSGGAGILVDELDNGDLVMVEGVLPTLPGAFSRALLFEEEFRNSGLMVDFEDLLARGEGYLDASSRLPHEDFSPTIIKFRLNPNEYYLFENRSVDPDGDGGTAVQGTLDNRVILYPTPFGDNENYPSYEYDYLLPSFIGTNGAAQGGGMLAWYVNETVLYQEGQVLEDGTLWSNFENNTVNTDFNRPGVRVLEADGLQDIGQPYSSYWTGTPYEYFHARKPLLNTNGQFVRWTQEPWRPTLSASTDPAMVDASGLGSIFYLDDISHPAALMSFTIKSAFLTQTFSEDLGSFSFPAPAINTSYSDPALPFYGPTGITLYSRLSEQWENLMGAEIFPVWSFDHPLINGDVNADAYQELIGVTGSQMHFMSYAGINPEHHQITFPDTLYAPLHHESVVYAHTGEAVYRVRDFGIEDFYSTAQIKGMALWPEKLALLKAKELLILNAADFARIASQTLPESFGFYEPLVWHHNEDYLVLITADSGNIYSYDGSRLKKIFDNPSAEKPSQPAIYQDAGATLKLCFGLGNYAYLMQFNGFLLPGFPLYLDAVSIQPRGYSRVLKLEDQILLYLPVQHKGYIAISQQGSLKPEYALLYPHSPYQPNQGPQDYMYYDAARKDLLWYYATGSKINIHSLYSEHNPLLWNGRNNAGAGSISGGSLESSQPQELALDAYVFPNPVKGRKFRVRVTGAGAGISVDIFDISGSKVFSQKLSANFSNEDIELDASRWSSGVYIVHVKSAKKSKTFKFAIEK